MGLMIWPTDWWHDANGALDKVHARLEMLLDMARAGRAEEAERLEAATQAVAGAEAVVEAESPTGVDSKAEEPESTEVATVYAHNSSGMVSHCKYRVSDPTEVVTSLDPDAFFEPAYEQTLMSMIALVVEREGPWDRNAGIGRVRWITFQRRACRRECRDGHGERGRDTQGAYPRALGMAFGSGSVGRKDEAFGLIY